MNASFITWTATVRGVPPGSVLTEPLLFNMYLNGLFMLLEKTSVCNFADDTTIYTCGPNIENLGIDAVKITEWFSGDFMKLSETSASFIILSWYRPPSDPIDTFDQLEQVMRFLELEGKEIILLADTNCDLSVNPNSTNGSAPMFSGNARHIKDMYDSFGLTQLISEPARETEQTSTLIDHIAVSNVRNISKSGVVKRSLSRVYSKEPPRWY